MRTQSTVMVEADRSEKELVRAAVAGNLSAFDDLVRRHWTGVLRLAMTFLRNSDEAEDVAQDAFLKAFERLPMLGPPYRFGPWVKQIARNLARNRCMRRPRLLASPRDAPCDYVPASTVDDAIADASEAEDLAERVSRAVNALSRQRPVLRETARLKYLSGRSVREIAQRLQVPVGTVKRRLWDARAKMRKEMTKMSFKGNDGGALTTVPTIRIEELPGASMRVPVRGYGSYFGSVLEVGDVEVCKFFDYPGGILTQTVWSEVIRKVNLFGRECFEVLIKHSDCEPPEPDLLDYFEVREDEIAWVLRLLADDAYAKVRNQVSKEQTAPASYDTDHSRANTLCRVVRLRVGDRDRGQCLAVAEGLEQDGTPAETFYTPDGRVVLHRRYVGAKAGQSPYYDFQKLPEEPNLVISGKEYRLWYDCVLVEP